MEYAKKIKIKKGSWKWLGWDELQSITQRGIHQETASLHNKRKRPVPATPGQAKWCQALMKISGLQSASEQALLQLSDFTQMSDQ